jgi:hypothetical protein
VPHPNPQLIRPVWERLAAWLAFLAVLSALWAPVSMLARDVQTGKLGGICSVDTASSSASGDASDDGAGGATSLRCDLCSSPGLVLPPLPVAASPCFSGTAVAVADVPANAGAAVPGLPFSRGPPAA